MSQVGQIHKQMMQKMEGAFFNLLDAQARLENADLSDPEQRIPLSESLTFAQSFLLEAQKLAHWLDTGEAE